MEALISFKTAKLAKEKGFNCPTNYFYYKDENDLDIGDGDIEFIEINHNAYDNFYSVPTQSILAKWLKKEYLTTENELYKALELL